MNPKTGRAAILFPHGVLFRQEEKALREKLVKSGLLECILGLGPGLFYNSPMEAVVVVLRAGRPADQRDKVLFINAVDLVARERAQSFLRPAHQQAILTAYQGFANVPGLAAVASAEQIANNGYSLAIPLYVGDITAADSSVTLEAAAADWRQAAAESNAAVEELLASLRQGVKP